MTRALRGAWSRRGVLLPLGLVGAVVLGGATVTTALVTDRGLGVALAAPLFLLGAVAVPECGHQLSRARHDEMRVARLRGLHGPRLWAWLGAEPLVTLLLGTAAGLGVALAVLQVTGHEPGRTATLDAVLVGGTVTVLGTLVVLLELGWASRAALDGDLEGGTPSGLSTRLGAPAVVLLFVAAAVAAYRSTGADSREPGWLVLAGPALLGLVAGQLAIWVVRVVGRIWTARQGAGLSGFLAARRLARPGHASGSIRLLVAGAVVASLAATGVASVGSWTEETAELRAGAAQHIEVEAGSLRALQLTREVDPDGKWLMAAEESDDTGEGRRVLVDTQRYARVLGDFLADTGAAEVTEHLETVAPDADEPAVQIASGDTVRVALRPVEPAAGGADNGADNGADGAADGGARARPVRVRVGYLNDENYSEEAVLRARLGEVARAWLPRCSQGCAITYVSAAGPPDAAYAVETLDFGGLDLTGLSWTEGLDETAGGLQLNIGSKGRIEATVRSGPLPVVRAGASAQSEGNGEAALQDGSGQERAAEVVGTSRALPLIEGEGLLGDLTRMLTRAVPAGVSTRALILARGDTPAEVTAAVSEAVGADFRTVDQVREATRSEVGGARARSYLVVGVLSLLTAVPVVLAAAGGARPRRRRDSAALRLAGLGRDVPRAAGRSEALVIAGITAALAVFGAAVTIWALLDDLTLIDSPAGAVPLQTGPAPVPILAAALVALALALLGFLVTLRGAARARPALLVREDLR